MGPVEFGRFRLIDGCMYVHTHAVFSMVITKAIRYRPKHSHSAYISTCPDQKKHWLKLSPRLPTLPILSPRFLQTKRPKVRVPSRAQFKLTTRAYMNATLSTSSADLGRWHGKRPRPTSDDYRIPNMQYHRQKA